MEEGSLFKGVGVNGDANAAGLPSLPPLGKKKMTPLAPLGHVNGGGGGDGERGGGAWGGGGEPDLTALYAQMAAARDSLAATGTALATGSCSSTG